MAADKAKGPAHKTLHGAGYTLELLISPDQLTAKVHLTRTQRTARVTAEAAMQFVRSAGLAFSKTELELLPAQLEKLLAGGENSEAICHGTAAKPWPAVVWSVPLGAQHHADHSSRKAVDLHQVTTFANVHSGQRLCRVPAPPHAGRDVFGHTLPVAPSPVTAGSNVGADPSDPECLVAQHEGCARLVDFVLSVSDLFEVKGDLDFKVGNIDLWGAVVIRGNVPDDFQIKATKDVVVEGSVGMAVIHAGGDLSIKGGVNGGRKARFSSGGAFHAHFLHGAHVEAGGSVSIDVECLDSVVHAGGDIKVARGGIIGGEARAHGNVEAATLGSELCVPTVVTAGHAVGGAPEHGVSSHRADLDAADATVAAFSAELAKLPLSGPGKGKQPPAAQLERMAALKGHLAEAQQKAHHVRRELAEFARAHGNSGAVVKASKAVFPRVLVTVGGVYTLPVTAELRGPATFSADHEKAAIKVVGRKANDEPLELAVPVEDPAAAWRWGTPALLTGLALSLMLSWTPGLRLLSQAGPLKVVGCEVLDDYAGSARAHLFGAKGQTLVLGWEELRHPEECVAASTLVEKRRWSFDYLYNGVPFEWPRRGTRLLGPLALAAALLAFAAARIGTLVARRKRSPPA